MSLAAQQAWIYLIFVGHFLFAIVLFLPVSFEPVEFHLPSPPYHHSSLPENTHLHDAQRILDGLVSGPESLAFKDGAIYSGTAEGKIMRINQDLTVDQIAFLGTPDCRSEAECSRPLGLRFSTNGSLYVIDAYKGIFSINITTGETTCVLTGEGRRVEGKPVLFYNDLDIQDDGIIYFTHSSTKWQRSEHLSVAMEADTDGRLLRFNPFTGELTVLLDGLALANGVQLSHDGESILVAEGGRMRIHRFFLKGPHKGTADIFAENLPGFVDNIRLSSGGGYWVALPTARQACIYDFLGPRPWLRRLLLKFFTPSQIFQHTTKPYGLILELEEDGQVRRRLDDPTGQVVACVSEVLDTGTHLYLGSYDSSYLARIDI